MTDHDLATCREWCRANGVKIVRLWEPDGLYAVKTTTGFRNPWIPPLACETEPDLYEVIWEHLGPWLASVRNMDAVEVPGPYKVQPWKVHEDVQYYAVTSSMSFDYFADMSEQSARRIAGILTRECGK